MLFWQTRCHFLCLKKPLTNCQPTVGGKVLPHLVMVFLTVVGSLHLYFLTHVHVRVIFYKKNPTEWSMGSNRQVSLWDMLTKAVNTGGSCRHFLEIPAHFSSCLKPEDQGKPLLQTASLDGQWEQRALLVFFIGMY